MDLESFRLARRCTLEEAAAQLGLRSKGYLSSLEKGRVPWPIRLALEVEIWSGGEVRALELLAEKDAKLLRALIARASASPPAPGQVLDSFREAQRKTLLTAAQDLGLDPKGYLGLLDTGETASAIRLAMQVDALSGGQLPAEQLLEPEDAELLRRYVELANARAA
jgi:transcriptional regulator with XRE-family HTH domain